MGMKALKIVLFALALGVSGAAAARHPESVVNYADIAMTPGSGTPQSVEQARQAIRRAAESRQWEPVDTADGRIIARKSWHGKHTISVVIAYTTTQYSVNYQDSINMNYGMLNGQPSIHPYYNRFVRELIEAIRRELSTR
jgi:hypothetical protein